jgi:hypothetical protein
MRPSARSSGVATVAAMVSGLAPGSAAVTAMVGKIHLRQRRHRQRANAIRPASTIAMVSSVGGGPGAAMKGAECSFILRELIEP